MVFPGAFAMGKPTKVQWLFSGSPKGGFNLKAYPTKRAYPTKAPEVLCSVVSASHQVVVWIRGLVVVPSTRGSSPRTVQICSLAGIRKGGVSNGWLGEMAGI